MSKPPYFTPTQPAKNPAAPPDCSCQLHRTSVRVGLTKSSRRPKQDEWRRGLWITRRFWQERRTSLPGLPYFVPSAPYINPSMPYISPKMTRKAMNGNGFFDLKPKIKLSKHILKTP